MKKNPGPQNSLRRLIILGAITSCVSANIFCSLTQLGAFTPWDSLGAPPSGAVHLENADSYHVWVKAANGTIYARQAPCSDEDGFDCADWKLEKDFFWSRASLSEPLQYLADCSTLHKSIFPSPPSGQTVECGLVRREGPGSTNESYYALMADGTLMYWENWEDIYSARIDFVIATFIIPGIVGIIISIIYWLTRLKIRVP